MKKCDCNSCSEIGRIAEMVMALSVLKPLTDKSVELVPIKVTIDIPRTVAEAIANCVICTVKPEHLEEATDSLASILFYKGMHAATLKMFPKEKALKDFVLNSPEKCKACIIENIAIPKIKEMTPEKIKTEMKGFVSEELIEKILEDKDV